MTREDVQFGLAARYPFADHVYCRHFCFDIGACHWIG